MAITMLSNSGCSILSPFLNVPGGVIFEAQLVHPQTFELISETSSGPTTFQSRPRPSARTLLRLLYLSMVKIRYFKVTHMRQGG